MLVAALVGAGVSEVEFVTPVSGESVGVFTASCCWQAAEKNKTVEAVARKEESFIEWRTQK
jgi:hypothetical protein